MLGRANSSPERQTNKKKKKHEKLSGVFSLKKRHVDTCSLFAKPPSLIPPAPPLVSRRLSPSPPVEETRFHSRWGLRTHLTCRKHLLCAGHHAPVSSDCSIEPS